MQSLRCDIFLLLYACLFSLLISFVAVQFFPNSDLLRLHPTRANFRNYLLKKRREREICALVYQVKKKGRRVK